MGGQRSLENNPDVLNALSRTLGLGPTVGFQDVYSLTDADLIALVPRPARALLAIIPMTSTWEAAKQAEDGDQEFYSRKGDQEPVVWFQQTVRNACGTIGFLHCALNGASQEVLPGSSLHRLWQQALPLPMAERAQMVYDSPELEQAHQSIAQAGQTVAPEAQVETNLHFVAFVKGTDGHLYELEGSRKGPLDRGALKETEDVLSERALDLGIRRILQRETEAGNADLRFSLTALVPC